MAARSLPARLSRPEMWTLTPSLPPSAARTQRPSTYRLTTRMLHILPARLRTWVWSFRSSVLTEWDGVIATATDVANVEGCIFTSPFCASVDDPKVVAFVDAYEEAYGSTPDQFAADAYDTVYTFKAAMEQAGSIESADMIAAMTEITVEGLTGDSITFDESGAPVKDIRFVTVKDGAYAYVEE